MNLLSVALKIIMARFQSNNMSKFKRCSWIVYNDDEADNGLVIRKLRV